jgi:hypothetical protein
VPIEGKSGQEYDTMIDVHQKKLFVIAQKDLAADVLPPPEFIIEAYLTALKLRDAKSP